MGGNRFCHDRATDIGFLWTMQAAPKLAHAVDPGPFATCRRFAIDNKRMSVRMGGWANSMNKEMARGFSPA